MIEGAFAKILELERTRFNAKFAEARWRRPALEPEAWAALLRATVAPIVEAVDRVQSDRTAEAAEALYDMALDLLGQELLGPRSPRSAVVAGWERLLPALPRFVAEAPHQVAGAVTNALYNLTSTPGARPLDWIDSIQNLAEVCPNVLTLLRAGQVAAWRAGLAHYRKDALEICGRLSAENAPVARVALGLRADASVPLEAVIGRLRVDPWLLPLTATSLSPKGAPHLKVVARVGEFRGLGGEFLTPPQVVAAEGRIGVTEGDGCWWLSADVFGATLLRAPALDVKPQTVVPRSWKSAFAAGDLAGYPHPQTISSVAATDTTLAVTSSLSYRVYLLAMVAPAEPSPPKPDAG